MEEWTQVHEECYNGRVDAVHEQCYRKAVEE